MKMILAGLVLVVVLLAPVRAQDEPEAEPGKAKRSAYKSTPLESLPRDQNGWLKPEVWDIVAAEAKANPNSNEARILADRPVAQAYYQKFANWKPPELPPTAPGKLRNLPDKPAEPRFPLTGKVWPSKPGEASVCLWADDKVAAMSLGVDDNNAMDLPYWKELSKKYGGLNITWNLITHNIDGVVSKGRMVGAGTWDAWRQMLSEGFRVASHSVMHNHCPVPSDGWPGPEWEAAFSKYDLEEHLPGTQIRVFAYPGAGVHAFGIGRDPKTKESVWRPYVAKYYAAARGGGGEVINPANLIDYMNIRSSTGSVPEILGSSNPRMASQQLDKLFDPAPDNKNYRGWANVFIHFINNGKDFDTNKFTVAYGKVLAYYNDHRADLWTGFFEDVALYGQERDTATLVTDEASDSKITFSLTSKMDPAIFDYPLTVKVRLPDSWKTVTASQNQKAVPAEIIQHEGAGYALVKALPDRGTVTMLPK